MGARHVEVARTWVIGSGARGDRAGPRRTAPEPGPAPRCSTRARVAHERAELATDPTRFVVLRTCPRSSMPIWCRPGTRSPDRGTRAICGWPAGGPPPLNQQFPVLHEPAWPCGRIGTRVAPRSCSDAGSCADAELRIQRSSRSQGPWSGRIALQRRDRIRNRSADEAPLDSERGRQDRADEGDRCSETSRIERDEAIMTPSMRWPRRRSADCIRSPA
jgi:hypothetical protein